MNPSRMITQAVGDRKVGPEGARTEVEDFPLPRQFDVVIERDEEGCYIASVPQLPGCHTQARSLDEVTERIREAVELCLEVPGAPEKTLEFVGVGRHGWAVRDRLEGGIEGPRNSIST